MNLLNHDISKHLVKEKTTKKGKRNRTRNSFIFSHENIPHDNVKQNQCIDFIINFEHLHHIQYLLLTWNRN